MVKQNRREVRFDLLCLVLVEGPGGTFYCVARNISEGGIFLETDQPLPLGSFLRVTIESPDSAASFVATGEVKHAMRFAYSDPNQQPKAIRGVGVRFVNFEMGQAASPVMAC
jgi:Tfp pilus assembly protein PilZ